MESASKDPLGVWFQILAERGYSDLVPFYLESLEDKRGTDFSFLHRQMDGAARLSQLLKQFGIEPHVAKERKAPSALRKILFLWKGLIKNSSADRPNWAHFDPSCKNPPAKLSWLLLSERATERLNAHAARASTSPNAVLLTHVSTGVAEHLSADPTRFHGAWMFPVNMRGSFPQKGPFGNVVSFLALRAGHRSPEDEIQLQIQQGLSRGVHWSNWLVYSLLSKLNIGFMRRMSAFSARRVFWAGTFSDLGDWTPLTPEIPADLQNSIWVAAPPGNPNNPVGCVTVTWCGLKSLSLRIHPSICRDPEQTTAGILSGLAAALCAKLDLSSQEIKVRHSDPRLMRLQK